MFESYAIKKLQAQVNRWPLTTWKATVPLRVDGVLDRETALRALTLLEHVQILRGDEAGKARTAEAYKDPIPPVRAQLGPLLTMIAAVGDAERLPPAAFVFPTQHVMVFGGVGLGLGLLIWWASRDKPQLALPAFNGYDESEGDADAELDDDDVIDAEYEEID